ncbi:MAG: ankyrin repeat domain-containing protein [Burkholderiaceae bacterium]|nr:ankyrin repeat domain-containing protein [Burkholderiaceae bacterium]
MHLHSAPRIHAAFPAAPTTKALLDRANLLLLRAIEYGNERESPQKIDEALQMGASIQGDGRYEYHPLVIAVRNNRPWAISTLMMRGADIPLTPDDGVDLLMEACRNGHVEMAKALVHVAQFSVGYADNHGKTALHYAVIAGEVEIVNMLINAGADVEASITGLEAHELNILFPYANLYLGDELTPLMIAAGTGLDAVVDALLEAGANPAAGDCSPLIIASRGNNHSIFAALHKHGASLATCKNANGLQGLAACIDSRMPVCFLRELVDEHDFTDDEGKSLHSPLGIAISLQNLSVIELLMAAGAPVDNHEQSDALVTVWNSTLPNGVSSSIAAELLTARAPAVIRADDLDGFIGLLQAILEKCQDPPALASFGIFTSLLGRCREPLETLARQKPLMHPRQWALEAAWIFQQSLPNLANDLAKAGAGAAPTPGSDWRSTMEQRKSAQLAALLEGSQRLIDHCMQGLTEATTLKFFIRCDQEAAESIAMSNFIKERILSSTGAPTPILRLVRDAWINAARRTQAWKPAGTAVEDGNRLLLAVAHNLMRKAIDDLGARDLWTNACLDMLRRTLPIESLALGKFCADPAAWLRKFEHRHDLGDPNGMLPGRIQTELGLPLASCEAIVARWRDALRAARSMRWGTPGELHAILKRQLAASIPGALLVGQGDQFTPQSALLMLPRAERALAARKRPAEREAPGAPRGKEPRTSAPVEASGAVSGAKSSAASSEEASEEGREEGREAASEQSVDSSAERSSDDSD